ncbi:hypothetical protein [Aureispira anguillae]|uniref:Uncharacterized protein n=1 Tax=Aureispira anguillae TaxID=2864201 RepID=A0A916DTC6_9BACT|nr:hypothetical protein [Aureispira anguillae]BDS13134.1 hypothetical protein AsAng_0038620 [Aureispira anguillae]
MKAYISPSVADDEQNILSTLSKKISTNGITPIAGYHKFGQSNSELAFHEINKANLFVGFITGNSTEIERVYNEWQFALKSETPALLVVEDSVPLDRYPAILKHPDVIRFSRAPKTNLNRTIQMVRSKSNAITNSIDGSSFVRRAAWFIGGPVVITFLNTL